MSGVRGAFAQLDAFHRQLAQLAADSFATELNRQLAAEAMTQLQLGFRASRDPYGTAWPALQRRQGNPLLDTGRLRNSFARGGLSARGFAVGTNVVYAATHQFGRGIKPGKRGKGGRIPARPMMPNGSRGFGPIWLPAFDAVIAQTMKKVFGK